MRSKLTGIIWLRVFGLLCCLSVLSACFHRERTNEIPIANAGEDREVIVGDAVRLDGGLSSDTDTRRLRYSWSMLRKPKASAALLADADRQTPFFIADVPGLYYVQLLVFDGESYSVPDQLTITTQNALPVAEIVFDAGEKWVGNTIVLDGSRSSDSDGNPLIYAWELSSKPPASLATINNAKLVTTAFTPDINGTYIVHLIVSDGMAKSHPATVTFDVGGVQTPIAEAGEDQAMFKPGVVQLDGSQSFNGGEGVLTYEWSFLLVPLGGARLEDARSVSPQFNMGAPGNYVLKLVVNNGQLSSHSDIVLITNHNAPGRPCVDCHDGVVAQGRKVGHMPVRDDCGVCHHASSFVPVRSMPMHLTVPQVCDVCHKTNGSATPQHPDHRATADDCGYCHGVEGWRPADVIPVKPKFDHRGLSSGCIDCHNGEVSVGKAMTHIPASNFCSACHATIQWLPALHLEHPNAFKICSVCHKKGSTVNAKSKPAGHIPVSANCDACHSQYYFKPVLQINHSEISKGRACVSCHNGQVVSGKGVLHPDSDDVCDVCHSVINWESILLVKQHAGVVDQCVLCHNNRGQASGPSAWHIVTTEFCEACHVLTTWEPRRVDHGEVQGECVECHDGEASTGKPNQHILTTDQCAACHASNIWKPAFKVAHTQLSGDCIKCHNGTVATGQSVRHDKTSTECMACHATNQWIPVVVFNHDELLTEQACIKCHNGKIVKGQPPGHMPTTQNCVSCHAASVWVPSILVDHNEVLSSCVGCHNFDIARGKSTTHVNTTDQCGACHIVTRWVPILVMDHEQALGRCVTCHKPPRTHRELGVVNQCQQCHSVPWWTNVSQPLPKKNLTNSVGK